MDGTTWFNEGHRFVGIGYDQKGTHKRDSSGWDRRYLTWLRLNGEVGFSGCVVGVGYCERRTQAALELRRRAPSFVPRDGSAR